MAMSIIISNNVSIPLNSATYDIIMSKTRESLNNIDRDLSNSIFSDELEGLPFIDLSTLNHKGIVSILNSTKSAFKLWLEAGGEPYLAWQEFIDLLGQDGRLI